MSSKSGRAAIAPYQSEAARATRGTLGPRRARLCAARESASRERSVARTSRPVISLASEQQRSRRNRSRGREPGVARRPPPWRVELTEGDLDDDLRLGSHDERAAVLHKVEATEAPVADDLLQRLTGEAAFGEDARREEDAWSELLFGAARAAPEDARRSPPRGRSAPRGARGARPRARRAAQRRSMPAEELFGTLVGSERLDELVELAGEHPVELVKEAP